MLNGHRPNIPNIDVGPLWSYPSSEKVLVNNSRRVRVPVCFVRKLSLLVVIHQIRYANRLFSLTTAILVDVHSQSIYRSPGCVFRWKLGDGSDHGRAAHLLSGRIVLAPEKFSTIRP